MRIQIVTHNNSNTIRKTLDSVVGFSEEIFIIDTSSSDDTLNICKEYGCYIIHEDIKIPKNKIRNNYIKENNWNLYLEPYEELKYGIKTIKEITKNNKKSSYSPIIIKQGCLIKETRLWNNDLKFNNPVHSCLVDNNSEIIDDVIIFSENKLKEDNLNLILDWKNKFPTNSEPLYYEACYLLSNNEYEKFLKSAELYLFHDNIKLIPMTLIKYYTALVYCNIYKNANKSLKYLLPCIISNPLMAEFWCLLGDIYLNILKDKYKAKAFYENAIFLGSKRHKKDFWPMEIIKYKEYPMNKIKEI